MSVCAIALLSLWCVRFFVYILLPHTMALRALSALRSATAARSFARVSIATRAYSSEQLSDADFDAKWKAYFEDQSHDEHAIRRGLNDLFAQDLVPEPVILEQALRACRRVDDFATTVRIFEGVKDKAADDATYQVVVNQLQPVIKELELTLPEELGF
eukprot:m.351904 g.351904  ORF g.351904 m.351904 type:complete len:158 (-) comp16396_c0_seq1:151-624(-)